MYDALGSTTIFISVMIPLFIKAFVSLNERSVKAT